MKIFAKTVAGSTLTLEVEESDSILRVKQMIQERKGIDPDHQELFLGGMKLEDDRALFDNNIKNATVLSLLLRLRDIF